MARLRGEQIPLLDGIQPIPLANLAPVVCVHPRAIPGLDAHYCPDCKKSIGAGTITYQKLLSNETNCLEDNNK